MKRTSYMGLLILFALSALGLYFLLSDGAIAFPVKPNTATPSQTLTATPPDDMGFEAVITTNADCLDWSNKILTNIEAYEQVSVLGRNKDGNWYMVRWPKLIAACWIEASRLKPSNFRAEELLIIPETFPPAFTPTATLTETSTITTTVTSAPIISSGLVTFTYTPTKTPKTKVPTSTPTYTLTSYTSTATITSTSTVTPTYTPSLSITPTFTPTKTLTDTPTPTLTITLTNTATLTSVPCARPTAPVLTIQQNGQSKNIELIWKTVNGALEYEVFRSENGGDFVSIGKTKKTSMKDQIAGNSAYDYFVIAINPCGYSDRSNVERFKH